MNFRRIVVATFTTLVSTVILGFLSGLCITRILETEGRGIYSLLQADVALITFLLSFSLPVTLVYVLAKEEHPKDRIFGTTLMALFLAGSIIVGAAVLAWNGWFGLDLLLPESGDRHLFILYLAWAIIYSIYQGTMTAVFLGLRLLPEVNRMNLIGAAVNLVLYGSLYALTSSPGAQHIDSVLHVAIVSQVMLAILWAWRYARLVGIRPRFVFDKALLHTMTTFSILGYASSLVHMLHRRIDIWLLSEFRGMGELGLYAVAVGVAQLFLMLPNPITQVLNPHLIREELDQVMPTFVLYARLVFTGAMLGGLVAAVLSPWLFPLLYGPSFAGSVRAFQLLMPGVIFASLTRLLALLVIRSGRMGLNLLASFCGLMVTVGINLWLIPRYGLTGAALASSLANFAVFIVVIWSVTVQLRIPMANYFILRPADLGRLWKS